MSLTGNISKKDSKTRQWFDRRLDSTNARKVVQGINSQLSSIVPSKIENSNPLMAGSAFDYGFRWMLGPLQKAVALDGAIVAERRFGWSNAKKLVHAIIQLGDQASAYSTTRARCCEVLYLFERFFRDGMEPPELLPFKNQPVTTQIIKDLCLSMPNETTRDVANLLGTIPQVWGKDLEKPFVLNPTFSGSPFVGGADADWIMGDTIFECKCTVKPLEKKHLLQAVGYILLDFNDDYGFNNLGWYFPRQQLRVVCPIPQLFQDLFGTNKIGEVRNDFRQSLVQGLRVTT